MSCSACGTDNRAGRKFCANCGTPLAVPCPRCGSSNEPGERFCGECGSGLVPAADIVGTPAVAVAGPDELAAPVPDAPRAERRLVSVLFADLVGFTAASQHRDPEETREVLSRYFELCRERIGRYGGTVEKFIGDAVMAVWGAPAAHEDDPERAVRAALDLVEVVGGLATTPGPPLVARAAVMTGEAAVSLGAEGQGMVAGDLVNASARLQSIAPPGGVLVDEATMQAAAAAIVFEPAGEQELRGREAAVAAYRPVRVVAGRRGSGRSDGAEAPFVGRDADLRLLSELFHATVRERRLRCVSITGQGGIGKSRLVWELEKSIDGLDLDVLWHQGRSPAYGEGVSFWALAEMVRARARIAESDDLATSRDRLRSVLAEYVPDEAERAGTEPALQMLLGLDPALRIERAELFAAWRRFLERLAEVAPVMLVFEDLHWADHGMVDFVEHLLEAARQRPILVVTLARPELLHRRPTWGAGQRNFTSIHLEPLPDAAMRRLLTGLIRDLPRPMLAAVLERAGGVPLYAVETVRMLVARGHLEAEGLGYRLVRPVDRLEIPDTLHALVAARLDTLSPAVREVAQRASVLGQSFTLPALEAVAAVEADRLRELLDQLVRAELLALIEEPTSPERGQYRFVQAVIQEVAHGTLARGQRKTLHLAAARYFEALGDEELAGVLASHYLEAHRAASAGREADSLRAQGRIALAAATERALALASHRQALAFLRQELELTDDVRERLDVLVRAGDAARQDGQLEESERLYREAAAGHRERGDVREAARASVSVASVLLDGGRTGDAVPFLETVRGELHDDADEVTVRVDAELARAYMIVRDERAETLARSALERAGRLGLVDVIAHLLATLGAVITDTDPYQARALLTGAMDLGDAYGVPAASARATSNLHILLVNEDPVASTRLLEHRLAQAQRLGDRREVLSLSRGLAMRDLDRGEWDRLFTRLDEQDMEELPPPERLETLWPRAAAHAGRDEHEEMERTLAEMDRIAEDLDHQQQALVGHCHVACLSALDRQHEAHERSLTITWGPSRFWAWLQAARAALALRDHDGAREAIANAEDGRIRGRGADAAIVTLRAGLLALDGDHLGAETLYRDALQRWRELGELLEHAKVSMEAATLLPPGATVARAAELEAREAFDRWRATAWLRQLERRLAERDALFTTPPSTHGGRLRRTEREGHRVR